MFELSHNDKYTIDNLQKIQRLNEKDFPEEDIVVHDKFNFYSGLYH